MPVGFISLLFLCELVGCSLQYITSSWELWLLTFIFDSYMSYYIIAITLSFTSDILSSSFLLMKLSILFYKLMIPPDIFNVGICLLDFSFMILKFSTSFLIILPTLSAFFTFLFSFIHFLSLILCKSRTLNSYRIWLSD